ncbi:MAG: hypothetical protein RI957_1148 [Verrucomicrobiota bacterium]|jgi:8-amino-7-oxononanoate synthase
MVVRAMQHFDEELKNIREAGLWRSLQPQEVMGVAGLEGMVSFASNDYLGLASDPSIAEAYHEGLQRCGHGSASSRLVCGTSHEHMKLEEELAELKGSDRCLTFSSGYAAAMGTIPAILGKDDFIIVDKLSHACLIDAAKLCGATMRVFPHNNTEKLESLLRSIRDKHGTGRRILVITESVFSMDGDTAPLQSLVDIKDRYQAMLLVDEAHGFGLFGNRGGGLCEQENLQSRVDLQMGTLSKAAGLSGGFIAGSQALIDLLINRARSFIYSTAPSPALAHAARRAVEVIRSSEGAQLRDTLQRNIGIFTQGSVREGHRTPIVPIVLGPNSLAMEISERLREIGFLVPAIRYPTVPRHTARLRVSLSARHTEKSLLRLSSVLADLLHDGPTP